MEVWHIGILGGMNAAPPCPTPIDALYISCDGTGTPMRDEDGCPLCDPDSTSYVGTPARDAARVL